MKTYTGACHCKNVTFNFTTEEEITEALECNCSICESKGSLLVFAPKENFELLTGESNMTEYMFNKKAIKHYFCKNCGVATHSEGITHPGVAINVRTVDGVEVQGIKRNQYNGRDL